MLANTYANLSLVDNGLSSKVAPKLSKQRTKKIKPQDSFFAPFSFNNTISDIDANMSKDQLEIMHSTNFNDTME